MWWGELFDNATTSAFWFPVYEIRRKKIAQWSIFQFHGKQNTKKKMSFTLSLNLIFKCNFCSPFVSPKISRESCLLTGLGKIFNNRYLVLRGISKVFITKQREISWNQTFLFWKGPEKNYSPFIFSVYFFPNFCIFFCKLFVLKEEKDLFSSKLSKKLPDFILHIPFMVKNNIEQILKLFI